MGEKSEAKGGSPSSNSAGVYQVPGDTSWRTLTLSSSAPHEDVYSADWINLTVRPPVGRGRGHPPGTVFELEAWIPLSYQPMDVKASLQGVSEVYGPSEAAELHGLFSTTDSNAVVLGNTFFTESSDTAEPASRTCRFTLKLPNRLECSCPASERSGMPSSWKSADCAVRYWVEITAEKLVDTRRWKGKGKAKIEPSGQVYRIRLPIIVSAPPLPAQPSQLDLSPKIRDELMPVSEWETTRSGRHTKLRFKETSEQKERISSIEFMHRITSHDLPHDTTFTHSRYYEPYHPSLCYKVAVSLGVHTYPGVQQFLAKLRHRAEHDESGQAAFATLSVERKVRVKRRTVHAHFDQPPLITTEPCRVSSNRHDWSPKLRNVRYKVENDLRLVGPPGERGVRAEEVFVVFKGNLVLERDSSWQDATAFGPRVKSCNIEVWHDLIVSFQLSPGSPPVSMRVPDVRFDLPASLAHPDDHRKSTEQFSSHSSVQVDPGRFPALAALYGGTRASSSAAAGSSGSSRLRDDGQLPPYVPAEGATPTLVDAKAALESSASSSAAAPPSYDAVASSPGPSTSAPRRTSIVRGVGRFFVSGPSLASSTTAQIPAYGATPPSALDTVLARDAPPSWEETVREDLAEEWLPAATAYADGGVDRSRAQARK
ncbi:hypothetical protein RTG_00697 [Rhodotorula toruloides ATCC 204091]|uniref:Uncharacterized protein n=1 Tax=Rhodotorula toruloides TaxID=5286 RepID=A0A0K3CS74_RHOTO|nr:hypothetical protein RTG_00697 [Rhodotorula toruloides ATCC 204091]PRQ71273.1 hypothetical protein AAT19DRAFT_10131 [Rhodotorula toruloides]